MTFTSSQRLFSAALLFFLLAVQTPVFAGMPGTWKADQKMLLKDALRSLDADKEKLPAAQFAFVRKQLIKTFQTSTFAIHLFTSGQFVVHIKMKVRGKAVARTGYGNWKQKGEQLQIRFQYKAGPSATQHQWACQLVQQGRLFCQTIKQGKVSKGEFHFLQVSRKPQFKIPSSTRPTTVPSGRK